jgi:hypothetical protein
MITRLLVFALLLTGARPVPAEEARLKPVLTVPAEFAMKWETNSALWKNLSTGRASSATIRIGRGDFELSGPLVEGFRPRRHSADRNLGQKILDLPVICLLVPQRMASPPGGGGRYFAWGESNRPWASVASGAAFEDRFTGYVGEKSQNNLISLRW